MRLNLIEVLVAYIISVYIEASLCSPRNTNNNENSSLSGVGETVASLRLSKKEAWSHNIARKGFGKPW